MILGFVQEVWRYFAVFLYVLTPTQLYDFWQEPTNTDELFEYCFPVNGWICWLCAWGYWAIELSINFIIQFAMHVVPLRYYG